MYLLDTNAVIEVTRPLINGSEVDFPQAILSAPPGTKSNVYLRYRGRSLRAIESTFLHETFHAHDYYSGYISNYYNRIYNPQSPSRSLHAAFVHSEIRAYVANIKFGYRTSHYVSEITRFKTAFNLAYEQ